MVGLYLLGIGLGGAIGGAVIVWLRKRAVGDDMPVRREKWTANFGAHEFASRGREFSEGNRERYRRLAGVMQQIRDHAGRPVLINCGERKPDHNADVGGEPSSKHLPPEDRPDGRRDGVACDFHVPGYSADETYRLWLWIRDHAAELGIGGSDFYPASNFIHVDTRDASRLVTWGDDSGRSAWERGRGVA